MVLTFINPKSGDRYTRSLAAPELPAFFAKSPTPPPRGLIASTDAFAQFVGDALASLAGATPQRDSTAGGVTSTRLDEVPGKRVMLAVECGRSASSWDEDRVVCSMALPHAGKSGTNPAKLARPAAGADGLVDGVQTKATLHIYFASPNTTTDSARRRHEVFRSRS